MKRKLTEIIKRYAVFFLGLIIVSFGIAFSTKAKLGTSPISSIPYSLSLILPKLSLGNWTILFSILLIALQIPILKKDCKPIELILETATSFVFGYVIDFASWCLTVIHAEPTMYIVQILFTLIGCMLVALGVFLQVTADVIMLPGDAFCRAIAFASKKQFGTIRMISDLTMALIAAALCLIFMRQLTGVREGTLIAALLVGNIVKLLKKWLNPFMKKLFPENEA